MRVNGGTPPLIPSRRKNGLASNEDKYHFIPKSLHTIYCVFFRTTSVVIDNCAIVVSGERINPPDKGGGAAVGVYMRSLRLQWRRGQAHPLRRRHMTPVEAASG